MTKPIDRDEIIGFNAFVYIDPLGRAVTIATLWLEGRFWVPLRRIADALLYETPRIVQPACDPADVREIFAKVGHKQRHIAIDAIFDATARSKGDKPDRPNAARHFHEWVRACMLPCLIYLPEDSWDERYTENPHQVTLRVEWARNTAKRFREPLQDFEAFVDSRNKVNAVAGVAAVMSTPLESAAPKRDTQQEYIDKFLPAPKPRTL